MRKVIAMTIVAIFLLSAFALKISAQERTIKIHDTDSSYNKTVIAGSSTTYNWSVENNGTRRYNVTISVENKDSDWNATTDKTAFDIQPREKVPVTLTVESPKNSENGTKNQVKVIFIIKPTTGPDFREEKYEKYTNTTIGEKTNNGNNGNVNIPNNPTEDFTEGRVATDYYKLVGLVALLLVLIGLLWWYFKKKKK